MSQKLKKIPVFGGAMTCFIPENAFDASKIRHIPDNQEVFLHKENNQSLIIDILEMPHSSGNDILKHPASFHFEIVGCENDVSSDGLANGITEIDSLKVLGSDFCSECEVLVSSVSGTQPVQKFIQLEPTNLHVNIVVFRLHEFNTDVVFSFNDPEDREDGSSYWDKDLFLEISRSLRLIDCIVTSSVVVSQKVFTVAEMELSGGGVGGSYLGGGGPSFVANTSSSSGNGSNSTNGWTSLKVGDTCEKIEYYQEVNALLCYHRSRQTEGANFAAGTESCCSRVDVLESTTGQSLRSYSLPYPVEHLLTLRKQEKILIAHGNLIGFTREVGGCLYLMPCLQLPVSSLVDEVVLELTFDEAKALQPCMHELKSLYWVDDNIKHMAADVESQIVSSLNGFSQLNDSNDRGSPETTNFVKRMKWINVKLKFQLKQFIDLISNLFTYEVESNNPAKSKDVATGSAAECTVLPILFSLLNRLSPLHAEAHKTFLKLEERVSKAKNMSGPHDLGNGTHVPGMCSEYARRLTFTTWPHYSYKWAKPDSMAKAGFYHMKGAHNGKDGAQCFKCRISLVKWEASDEPWNEHEQHSPSCLFLKGDPTHNVPIADTVAFSPGVKTTDKKPVEAISVSSHPFFVATSSKDGSIHIWNCHAVPKLYYNFSIDVSDEQITNVFSNYPEDSSSSTTGYSSSKAQMWAGCSPAFFMEEVVSETQDALGNNQMKYENYPQVTFPPEDTGSTSGTETNSSVTVTSLALTGFGGVNPSPFGCLVIAGCMLSDPRINSNRPKETCVLIFKVDVSDLRAVRHALFNSPPDHTNLLLMDDKYSNFASEMATSMPIFSQGITEEMMITDAHEDLINMEIDLPHSEPDFIYYGDDSSAYQENVDAIKASMYCDTSIADPFNLSESSGIRNKLYNLTDAKLLQAFPIQLGSKVTHILTEQCDNQSFLYAVASKNSSSSIYVFQLNRDVATSKFVESSNPLMQSKHGKVLKLNCNHQYTEGVISHVFLLPAWTLHTSDLPFFEDKSVTSSFLLCIDNNDNIFLFFLPGLEIMYLQTSEKKKLLGGSKIKSASFDWGSDCLSVLTDDGKVHFIELRQLVGDSDESSSLCGIGQIPGSSHENQIESSNQLSNENNASQKYTGNKFDYLFDHKGQTPELNTATLDWINQISECVALTPRYNVTIIPPGWVEIEQEQQQRKLSEHLPRGGSSANHTRTFRINKDTMNKALIELALPFTVVLGHVDLKLQFKKPPPADLTAALYRPCTEYSSKRSGKEKSPTENEKLVGPVNVNIFAFGPNNCSVNVSLSGPNLYLTKHRVILLELFSSNSSLGMNEVSITLRRTKKPQTQRTVAQIRTVLHDPTLVGKLLKAVTNPEVVSQVGDTREFYMSHFTIRHTALNVLTWLLYIHAVDNSNSETSNLATFYLSCSASDRLVKDLIQTCFINGDRSLAHLFARFVSMLLRFKAMRAESQKFCSDMKKALIDLLPSSVLCSSQGGMYWFHLVFHAVVVQGNTIQPLELSISNITESIESSSASSNGVFDSCLRLLEYLTNCNEVSQDVYIKTLQSKFRVFCNPFEQRIFTFPIQTIAPNVMKKTNNNNPGAMSQTVNKWLMPPIPIPENANANKTAETLHMMFSARRRLSLTDDSSVCDEMLNKSFVDLFVPFSANSFTMENQLIGFLEAEPLRFSCHESSDGVKLHEMTQNTETGSNSQSLTTEYDDILNEPGMSPTLVQLINLATSASSQPGMSSQAHGMLYPGNFPMSDYVSNSVKNMNQYYAGGKVGKSYADAAKSQSSSSMQTRSNAPMSDAIVGSIGGSLTHTPQPQYMLIDNLLAGGRKFVVIDFGRTVMLTDVYLGPCSDLASITLDCWIKGEAIDSLRVTTSLDVASEPLVLTDIQPPLFCRYLKIKVIGRYGMPTHGQSKVLLPINTFYGHSLDYEYETIPRDSKFRCIGDLQEKHLKTLSIIHEDLLCRYSLAANHLKSLLKSHSVSLASNSAEEKRFVADVCSNCRVLQRQLNVVSRVIERIKAQFVANEPITVNSLSQSEENPSPETLSLSSANSTQISHSTRFILICMLEIARQNQSSMVFYANNCSVTEEQCRYFFGEICVKGLPNNGVLALTVLHSVSHTQTWWPNFLSTSFLQYFQESNSPEMLLHIVKVFLTLLFLAKQDGLINPVMMSFISLLLNGTADSNRPIVPPVNNALLVNQTTQVPMTSSSINDSTNSTPNCNWSQLSAILMIMSQAMSDSSVVPKKQSSKPSNNFAKDLSSRWDFFPSILKADYLADKSSTGSQDKGRMGSSSKKDKRSKCAYGMTRLGPVTRRTSASGSKDKAAGSSGRNETDKEKLLATKKRCDVQLPVAITHELITRLLCVLPEVIRSHSSDLVILLCRQISLLVLACDHKTESPISVAQLFPGNLLSQILLNAFVVTSNQLTTYAVQSLISDLIEAEVRDVLTNRSNQMATKSGWIENETNSDRIHRRKDLPGSTRMVQSNKTNSNSTEELDLPSTSSGSTGSSSCHLTGPTKCPISTPLAPLHEDFTMEMMATDMQELFPSSNPVAFVTTEISLESLLSDETAALDCKSDEVIQELLKMDNLYSPVFGQSQHYAKKGCVIGKQKGEDGTSKEQQVKTERSGDCLDIRLESGILHHPERWLTQLQTAFSKCVHKNLACLNFNSHVVPNSERKTSSQMMPNEVHFEKSNVTRANITFDDSKKLLQAVFNDLLSPRNLPYLDLKELLLCWYRVNSVRRLNSDHLPEKNEPMEIIIGMSSDNMAQIFNKLTVESISDSVVWNLLFQCLIMYASSSESMSMTPENRIHQSAPSILIRNLIHYPVLDTFLSGSWSPGGIRSEQCRGPGVTETFGLFLEELTSRNEDKHLLDQLLMKLLKSLCEFSGAIKQGYGPVDCQIELASTMFNSSCQTHDPKLICSLVNVICKLGYDYISGYRTSVTMTAQSNASKFVNYPPNVCITAFESNDNKLAAVKKVGADQNGRETLLKHLFKLAQKLVSSKVNPSQLSNISGESTVADFIICDDQLPVVNTLLITLSSCSLPCAPEQLAGGGSSFMQVDSWLEEFKTNEADFEEKTLGDHILKLLFCIENHAHERKVLHQRLVHSLNSSVCSTLSQPVLFFLLYLLKSFEEVHMFASVGGIQVLVNKIVRNSETGPGFNFSMQPLHVLQKLTQCFEIDVLDLDLTDMPKNIGPKASISCSSDPTAQLPDVLLQENPPHKRARAAAWTYHFPANDVPGYCSLSITLPHLSVLHYVEVRVQVPAMGVSHNMPSSISMDIVPSRNRLTEPASCSTPPLIIGRAAGGNSSFIQLRPHEPQLCGSLLLRIYHPPDANSIGLSHIAIYAKPVLSDLSQARGFADHLITSLHAFKLIEHCLETQFHTLSKRRQAAFPTPCSTELMNVPSILSEGLDAPTRDRLLSSCLSLLSQNTAQHFFMSLKKTVLCLATTAVPESVTSGHENMQQIGGHLQSEEQQAETVQHVIVFLLNSFVNGTETLTDVYVDEVLDLLFSLCTQGDNRRILLSRMSVLVSWLEANLQTISDSPRISLVSVAHLIHAISAILWQLHSVFSASLGTSNPMPMVVTAQNFTNLCQHVLNSGFISENNISVSTVLKSSFDWLLCAYTHMHPSFLKTLLRLLGCRDLQTQDLNSASGGPMSPPSPVPSFAGSGVVLNDDAKQQKSFLAKQWWANLGRSQLATLHHCLLDTRVLDVFRNFAPVADMFSLLIDLSLADESKGFSAGEDSASEQTNVKTLIRLLEFLTNISENNPRAKRWLGQAEKTRFWSPLLTSLCYDQSRQHCLSLTEAALRFFETVADDNTNNQRNLAEIVSQLISQKKDALNSFVKQLILNVFLKEERVLVVIKSSKDKLIKWSSGFDLPAMGHPKYGIGHHVVYGKIDAESTVESLVSDIVDQNKLRSDSRPIVLSDSSTSSSKPADISSGGIGINYTISSKTSKLKSSKVPASQKLCKIEQKKKMLEKIFSTKSSTGLVKHLAKHPTAYWASKLKNPQKLSDEPGTSISVVQSAPIVSASKLWRCIHKTLGSDWLPNNLTFRQLLNCLKQVQSRDVEEGFIKLNLVGLSSQQYDEMDVAIAESLDALSESPLNAQFSHVPRPPQVFASVGGFTKLALRIPVLNPDFVKLMCAHGKESSGGNTVTPSSRDLAALGFPNSDQLDLSDWVLVDPHALAGNSTGGAGKHGFGYNSVIDVETSDEENYPLDWVDEMGSGAGASGTSGASNSNTNTTGIAVVAPHCLALLGLTLQLPLYVEVLLREERKARFLLRILLGVSDIGDSTTSILSTPEAKNLSTLPLEALRSLFDEYPVNTELGLVIRQQCVDAQILDLLFGCLAVLTHRNPNSVDVKSYQFLFPPTLFGCPPLPPSAHKQSNKYYVSATDGSMKQQPQYWAKGTGFGTGSMQSGWNMEQSFLRRNFEEQNCCAILQVLAAFIAGTEKTNVNDESRKIARDVDKPGPSSSSNFMAGPSECQTSESMAVDMSNFSCRLHDLVSQSCLLEVLNSYLNNDSVLDISRHVAVYQAVLDVIRSMVTHRETSNQLFHLLEDTRVDSNLRAIRSCVYNYTNQLCKNLKFIPQSEKSSAEAEETEGINRLSVQLDAVHNMVEESRKSYLQMKEWQAMESRSGVDSSDGANIADNHENSENNPETEIIKSPEEIYCKVMKNLQFLSYRMIKESGKNLTFNVAFHFLSEARLASDSLNTKRAKRLAQESVTLSSSLPLDYSSSVFLRYDEERLDVMKVLITGPVDTPYENGCFVFDIFFPADYPNSPLLCNFATTGVGTVRFNPNLYNDGKVCLSILNTWHGRPEEKWNSQTSNLLQVLVSIQSLILVSEPYFNEPGYERSRNTPAGQQSSNEYSANIKQATVKWAMLNQLKNPCPSFKDVIQAHFYLKKEKILKQVNSWLVLMEMMDKNKRYGKKLSNHVASLKKSYTALAEELNKLEAPDFVDDETKNAILKTNASSSKQVSFSDASTVFVSANDQPGLSLTSATVKSLFEETKGASETTGKCSTSVMSNFDATNLVPSSSGAAEIEVLEELKECPQSPTPQSPTSKAATDLLNSVLDVVFWSPTVDSSNPAASGNTKVKPSASALASYVTPQSFNDCHTPVSTDVSVFAHQTNLLDESPENVEMTDISINQNEAAMDETSTNQDTASSVPAPMDDDRDETG